MDPAKPAMEHKIRRQEQVADSTPLFTCLGETQLSSDVKELLAEVKRGKGTLRNTHHPHPSHVVELQNAFRWLDCGSAWGALAKRKALASVQLCVSQWDGHE